MNNDATIGSTSSSAAPSSSTAPTLARQETSSAAPSTTTIQPTSITMAPPTGLTSSIRSESTSTDNPICTVTPGTGNDLDLYRYGMPFAHPPIATRDGRETQRDDPLPLSEQPTNQHRVPPMGDLENMLRALLDNIDEGRRRSAREEQTTEPVARQIRRNLFIEVPPQSPSNHRPQLEMAQRQHSPSFQHPYLGPAQPQHLIDEQRPVPESAPSQPGTTLPHDYSGSPRQRYYHAINQAIPPQQNEARYHHYATSPPPQFYANARQETHQPQQAAYPARSAYDLERDREIAEMREQMREMTSQVHQAIRAAPEVDRVLRETLSTPFTDAITSYPLRSLGKMTIPTYDGTSDPSQHLQTFTIAMGRARFTPEERDAGYCQLFVENLRDDALRWFTRLGTNTISNFHQLSTAFVQHYLMYVQKEASTADLWAMTQEPKESLRKFIDRFKKVASKVTIPDVAGIMALQKAALYARDYRHDILVNKPQTLEDALHRAAAFIELEEDEERVAKRIQAAVPTAKPSAVKDKAVDIAEEPRQHIGRDYAGNRPQNTRRPPAVFAMNDRTPAKPAWNKYVRDGAQTGDNFCDYHNIPGHATHECRSLQQLLLQKFQRGEIDDLNADTRINNGAQLAPMNQGRLQDPRHNNNQRKRGRDEDDNNQPPPPPPKKLIN